MKNLPALCKCNILLLSKEDKKTAKAVQLRDKKNKKILNSRGMKSLNVTMADDKFFCQNT